MSGHAHLPHRPVRAARGGRGGHRPRLARRAPAFALARRRRPAGAQGRRDAARRAHPEGAILVAACDGKRLVTGGDDGRVVATLARRHLPRRSPRRAAPGSTRSRSIPPAPSRYAAGRKVTARDDKGRTGPSRRPPRRAASPSRRRAIGSRSPITTARRSGIRTSSRSPSCSTGRARISTSTWSPDGRFVVTSMQENSLHGWRLAARSRPHADVGLCGQAALAVLVLRRAPGSRPPAPTPRSSGRSVPRKARPARRRANAACGTPA